MLMLRDMFPTLDPNLIRMLVENEDKRSVSPEMQLESLLEKCLLLTQSGSDESLASDFGEVEEKEKKDAPKSPTLLELFPGAQDPLFKDAAIEIEPIEMALDQLIANVSDERRLKTALNVLVHCCSNILEHPEEEKYRKLRIDNEALQKKLLHLPGAVDCLNSIGFTQDEGDSRALVLRDPDLELISVAAAIFRDSLQGFDLLKTRTFKPPRKEVKPASDASKAGRRLGRQPRFLRNEVKAGQLKELHMERLKRKRLLGTMKSKLPYAEAEKTVRIPEEEAAVGVRPAKKREFTLRDIEEMRKNELLEKARKGTKDTFLDRIGQEALIFTNKFRVENGLPQLHWHQGLADIGKVHSARMGTGKVPVGHDGFKERVEKYPFPYASAAENVAFSKGYPVSEIARLAVEGWINSP